jgi:hypothetical protein
VVLGLPVQHRSALWTSRWMLLRPLIAVQITAPEAVDKPLGLSYVSAERGGFHPHLACPAVPAGDAMPFHQG